MKQVSYILVGYLKLPLLCTRKHAAVDATRMVRFNPYINTIHDLLWGGLLKSKFGKYPHKGALVGPQMGIKRGLGQVDGGSLQKGSLFFQPFLHSFFN